MATPAYFLGLDVARSGLGLVVLSGDGVVAAAMRRAYGSEPGTPMDPQDWWRAARTGIKEILRRAGLRAEQIRSIGVTGDDAIIAIGKDGKALCPAILGPDPRCASQVEQLTKLVGARNLLNLASGQASDSAAAVKLLWLRDNEKRVWHDLAHVLPAKDFLRYRLTDTFVTDACDASATLLFNPKTRSWSKQLLSLLEVHPEWLPAINNGPAMSGRVTDSAARESGLQAGTPVVTGAGHAAATAIATGVLNPGSAVIELGGQGSLLVPTAEASKDPHGRLTSTCHCLAGTWALTGTDLASSPGLDWIMDQVLPVEVAQARRNQRDPLDLLSELAAEVPPGSEGLMYLSATRAANGGFVGLEHRHHRGHLVRAVMESGALACRNALTALTELKRGPAHILVTGPGATNHLWCQILADALDRTIAAVPVQEAAALGAATLAASAVGVFKGIEDACAKLVKTKGSFHPRRAASDVYQGLAPIAARLSLAIPAAFAPQASEAKA